MVPPIATPADPDPGARARFAAPYRVRFDESTSDGTIRTSSLLRYTQDCAWLHSESLGFGRDWYAERDLAWVVRVADIEVRGTIRTGDRLIVSTEVRGFRRVWARRWTGIADEDGRTVVEVETDWVMTDTLRGAPTRIPDDFPGLFGVGALTFEPRRVRDVATPPDATRTSLVVRRSDLDPMDHANNAAYLDWLEEVVARMPSGERHLTAERRGYTLEYLVPALAGDRLDAAGWADPDRPGSFLVRLATSVGDVLRARFQSAPSGAPSGAPGGGPSGAPSGGPSGAPS